MNETHGYEERVIDEELQDVIKKREDKTVLFGSVVDIAIIDPDEPYENADVYEHELTGESRRVVNMVAETDLYESCIIVFVEIESGDIIADIFTSKSSDVDDYPAIESLAMALGIDRSSTNLLPESDKKVPLIKENDRWSVVTKNSYSITESTIGRNDILLPIIVSVFSTAAIFVFGEFAFAIDTVISAVTSAVIGFIMFFGIAYAQFVSKRDHTFPGVLQRVFTPHHPVDNEEERTRITEDSVNEVHNASVKKIVTTVPDTESGDERAILNNAGFIVDIPPVGEKLIRVPTPVHTWNDSVMRKVFYSVTPSAFDESKGYNKTIPVKTNENNELRVDTNRLENKTVKVNEKYIDRMADRYVETVADVIGGKTREELYEQ